ncbi:MAG: hypothetical protein NG784_13185 [Candidatus Jettenia sp.]|nr:hypothetical protein [Candidatus Jettenia sp.]
MKSLKMSLRGVSDEAISVFGIASDNTLAMTGEVVFPLLRIMFDFILGILYL